MDGGGTRAEGESASNFSLGTAALAGDTNRAQWLSSILAHSPDIICILDLEGTIRYLNRTTEGRSITELIGRPIIDMIPVEDHAIWRAAFLEATASGTMQRVELRNHTQRSWDTRVVPIRESSSPGSPVTWVLAIASDITAQRLAESELQLKDEQLSLALDASGMGQWTLNVASRGLRCDLAGKRMFDWPLQQDEISEAEFIERVHAADRSRVQTSLSLAMETGSSPDLQFRIVLPDASTRWIFSKGRAVRKSDGKVSSLVGGWFDITHGKRTEEQLQRSAKLEAIGQLAGGIAHDFNNLLVAILGNLDLARQAVGPEHDACLDDAGRAANRAAELTKHLLVFSRRQPLNEELLDCGEFLRDTLRLLRRLLPESILLEVFEAHRLPRVRGDRGQLEQVIVNLCINARDAMPEGGRLRIETEAVLINGRFRETHPSAKPGRYVLISVSDTGVGIPREQLDHIFEPFFTTKAHGTGLGLATAYGTLKRHGGLLHVYSEVGKGTTFKVYLPVAERDAVDVGPKVDSRVRGGSELVLLAEDEPAVRAVVKRIVERAGYRVVAVQDGEEAVEYFRKHGEEIDLLLLDAVMPRKGGNEAMNEIRELNPNVPVLLCSGYTETPLPGRDVKGVLFLAKPYEPDQLLGMMRTLLDGKERSDV
jgi:PAS domain S-box-containing protein